MARNIRYRGSKTRPLALTIEEGDRRFAENLALWRLDAVRDAQLDLRAAQTFAEEDRCGAALARAADAFFKLGESEATQYRPSPEAERLLAQASAIRQEITPGLYRIMFACARNSKE